MKTILLIIGAALFIVGIQDAIRLLVGGHDSLLSFIPGGTSLYVGLDVVFIVAGAMIAGRASKMKEPSSK